jgi:S-adenosylmethionine hydrolase
VVDLVRLDWQEAVVDEHGLRGQVIATDGPFGNLVTNVSAEDFFRLGYQRGKNVPVMLGEQEMTLPFVRTFNDVPLDKPLLYIDSRGRLSFAINQGNFAGTYDIKPPVKFSIPKAKD